MDGDLFQKWLAMLLIMFFQVYYHRYTSNQHDNLVTTFLRLATDFRYCYFLVFEFFAISHFDTVLILCF